MKTQLSSLLLTILFMAGLNFADFQESEVRNLSAFENIDVSGGIKLYIESGNDHTAKVEVENAELADLITEVKNDKIKIYFKENLFSKWKNKSATVTLTYKELKSIDVSSGCYVETKSTISASDFELSCSSGTRVILDFDVDDLEVSLSSGTSMTLEGSANSLAVEASSGCTFDASELECKSVMAEARSGTSLKVWATESITANAKSGSAIKYRGNPGKTQIESGVSGSVSKMR